MFLYGYASKYKYRQYCYQHDHISKDQISGKSLDFSNEAKKGLNNEASSEYKVSRDTKEVGYI